MLRNSKEVTLHLVLPKDHEPTLLEKPLEAPRPTKVEVTAATPVAAVPFEAGWVLHEKEGRIWVSDVKPDSLAIAAGFRKGDRITAINDVALDSPDGIGGILASEKPGSIVVFQVERGTRSLPIKVTIPAAKTVVERPALVRPAPSFEEVIRRQEIQEEMLTRILAELEALRAELKVRK